MQSVGAGTVAANAVREGCGEIRGTVRDRGMIAAG